MKLSPRAWPPLLLLSALLALSCAKGDDSRGPADPSSSGSGGSGGSSGSAGSAGSGGSAGAAGSAGTAGAAGKAQAGSGGSAGGAQAGQGGGGQAGEGQGGAAGQGTPCNPVTQSGCKADQACFPQNADYVCDEPGTLTEGQACTFASECAGGHACLKLAGETKCFRICDPAGGASCGGDQKCSAVKDPYGICVPK